MDDGAVGTLVKEYLLVGTAAEKLDLPRSGQPRKLIEAKIKEVLTVSATFPTWSNLPFCAV